MALMLDTDGAPLKRFWCLYEIMTVMRLRQEGRDMPDARSAAVNIITTAVGLGFPKSLREDVGDSAGTRP